MKDAVVASPPPFAVCIKKRLSSASANNAYGDCQRRRRSLWSCRRVNTGYIMSVNQHLLFLVCLRLHSVVQSSRNRLSTLPFRINPRIFHSFRTSALVPPRHATISSSGEHACVRACVCLSIVSVVSLRDQRALSNEPDRMTSHSVRSRRKSTNLPQRARARGARALPSLSLRPRRRLLNYYSHLPLPLIKLARPAAAATAAASSRVAYTLTGFFKSKLITISREQRHSHARADLGGEKQQERSKGLTGKSIFHQSIVHPLAPSRRRVDGRPTDGQQSKIDNRHRFVAFFVDDFSAVAVAAVHNG